MQPIDYLAFGLRRLAQAVVVMFVISLIGFSIRDNLGDPLRELVGQSVSEAERQALRDRMGLNDPFLIQYGRFLANALQGDLGTSYFFKKPALEVIFDKFPATFELVLGATLIIVLVSVPLGVYCAINPAGVLARMVMVFSIVGISIPVFLTAIFAIYIFAVELGWMPSFGRGEVVELPWGWKSGFLTADGLHHLVLPCIALSSILLPLPPRSGGLDQLRHTDGAGCRRNTGAGHCAAESLGSDANRHHGFGTAAGLADRCRSTLFHSPGVDDGSGIHRRR